MSSGLAFCVKPNPLGGRSSPPVSFARTFLQLFNQKAHEQISVIAFRLLFGVAHDVKFYEPVRMKIMTVPCSSRESTLKFRYVCATLWTPVENEPHNEA
jgi:hypothetical protein